MVNILQTFVTYHGCGNGYTDGVRKMLPKNNLLDLLIIHFGKSQLMLVAEFTQEHNSKKNRRQQETIKEALFKCFFKRIF